MMETTYFAEEALEGPRITYTDAQGQAICTYVKGNYEMLFPKTDKPNTKRRLLDAWEGAARSLMSAGLPLSHTKKAPGLHLRDLWHKMVSLAKKYRDDRSKTGGGPRPRFDQRHEMVLDCLPDPLQRGFLGVESEGGNIIALLTNNDQQQQLQPQHQQFQQQPQEQQQQPQPQHQQFQQQQPQEQKQQPQPQEQQQQQPQPQEQQHLQPLQQHQHLQPLQQQQQQDHQQQQQHYRLRQGQKRKADVQLELLELEREKVDLMRQRLDVEKEQVKVLKQILGKLSNIGSINVSEKEL